MSSPYAQVPVLPVVGVLGATVLVVLVARLRRERAVSPPRVLVATATSVYLAGIVAHSVFPVFLDRGRSPQPWWWSVHLTPVAGTDPADMLQNVVVFVPLGVLVPLLLPPASVRRVVLVGFSLSLAIELLQLANSVLAQGGHVTDVNDLLANTLGAPLGYALLCVAARLPVVDRLVVAARWPTTTSPGPVTTGSVTVAPSGTPR